ncbi:non-ribosomal peptide synthetase [Pseudanabaena sp. UWO310]|uniref:non-ribosomal peptide synthetase n=1 Tax=Pseudanabaena sp. UWO310 TaxID=2480795 RepID=UPI001157A845|nr:non-ribosomal peptide synthetase [Pseudanabaena sp. UWO310]TYQ29821.1 amino acid adenylation domain-containing protein [Pseudanabaena sp. UWO310]
MNLYSLLNSLSNIGIKLSAEGESLLVDAPQGVLTAELRDSIINRKSEILALLHQHQTSPTENDLPAIVPDPESRYEPFPLTDMQHAFWIGRSGVLTLGNVSNHGYYEIEGSHLDLDRLNRALQQSISRHDMLRAIVRPDGQQQILKEVPPYHLAVVDLRGQTPTAIADRLAAIREEMSHQVLPADRYPLFDFRVTYLDGDRTRLHISYDLLVFDAWSLFRLFEEWFQLYQCPEAVLPPLELSFRDYVLAEQSLPQTKLYQRSQEYWLKRLSNLPPAPELPLAKNPQELKQHRCKRYHAQMERDDWQRLQQKAKNIGLTPSGLLLAAFAEIIALWSQNPQFTLNLALFNRLPMHPHVNHLLGDFTSVTLLEVDNSRQEAFGDRALRLQKQLWQDLEHRYFSGVRVTRELTRQQGNVPNAMPVIFTSTLGFAAMGQETLTFSHFGELVYGISQASQAWMDVQVWEEKETLTFNWDVVDELFPDGAIADMFATYCHFLERLAKSEEIWIEPNRQLLTSEQLLNRNIANFTDADIPKVLLQELFKERVREYPDLPAVITSQKSISYQELSDRAHQVGYKLRHLGVVPNQLVAIVMEKGWEQIVAVMGVLLSGAAYVPIAPDLPPERLQYLLKNSEAQIVLTQSWLDDTLIWDRSMKRFCLDREDFYKDFHKDFHDEKELSLPPLQNPDDLAYVIYTSGSTGLPKGVMITHRNVANVIVYTNQNYQVTHRDRILALTALNHDLSVYDIFGMLSAGGAIVLPDARSLKDPHHWADLIETQQVTLWNSVPAMMEMLVNAISDRAASATSNLASNLRLAILGGDWFPVSLPHRIRAVVPHIDLLSIGGPTETTIWNIGYQVNEVSPDWKSIPYGQPMTNSKYYILNEALDDCPTWVAGQMYCAGVQVAKGYWQDETRTKAAFITHPRTGERIYRTGDRGRYLKDGTIEFLGRVDFQIKLRGQRMEAGEIEAALMQHPKVKTAIIKIVGEGQQAQLAAYIIPQMDDATLAPTVEELSQFLGHKLPSPMIPSIYLFLDKFPLSANGKVDRQALPTQVSLFQTRVAAYTAPQNAIERAIASVLQAELELEKVGVNDNFFDLGANSLLITNVYRKLGLVLPQEIQLISLVDLFSYPTVKALAQRLTQGQTTNVLEQQKSAQRLDAGKNRIKQRLDRSKQTNVL